VWFAIQQGYLETSINPFKDVPIKNFKKGTPRFPFTRLMLTKLMEASQADKDLRQLIEVSYYTGMRLNEAFTTRVTVIDGVYCFDVASEGGKTKSAQRIIPIHLNLLKTLSSDGDVEIVWSTKTATALGKRFGRLKDRILEQIDTNLEKRSYCHHSFRHGFTTMLLESGYQEIEMADLTGHKRSNMGRTEAGRTYFGRQNIKKLMEMVSSISKI
jgi:integrase